MLMSGVCWQAYKQTVGNPSHILILFISSGQSRPLKNTVGGGFRFNFLLLSDPVATFNSASYIHVLIAAMKTSPK